jgi:predicted TIM-barrel fold metal-dependent hydrolase
MIIDVHGHVSAPPSLSAWQAGLIASRGAHGKGSAGATVEAVRESHQRPLPTWDNRSHIDHIDTAGIDRQLISPRPFTMMHSEDPATIVRWYAEETNDIIKLAVDAYPDRFRGVAGLPQSKDTTPAEWIPELRRAVNDLGMVGAMINPDPMEGLTPSLPALGQRWWYPIYEAACELDVPLLIHSASCRPPARENYSLHFITEETINLVDLVNSSVFEDFPTLKIVCSHGGGAVPYQLGRLQASGRGHSSGKSFQERLRNVYFDTCLYTKDALELLFRAVGTDRCLFGTERPGTGTQMNPETGKYYDDIAEVVSSIEWLTDADKSAIFEDNARSLYRLEDWK